MGPIPWRGMAAGEGFGGGPSLKVNRNICGRKSGRGREDGTRVSLTIHSLPIPNRWNRELSSTSKEVSRRLTRRIPGLRWVVSRFLSRTNRLCLRTL
jgi:hypothetical protein